MRNIDLSGDNVLDMWQFASQFESDLLKLKVLIFLKDNLHYVIGSADNIQEKVQRIVAILGCELILFQANLHPLQAQA